MRIIYFLVRRADWRIEICGALTLSIVSFVHTTHESRLPLEDDLLVKAVAPLVLLSVKSLLRACALSLIS